MRTAEKISFPDGLKQILSDKKMLLLGLLGVLLLVLGGIYDSWPRAKPAAEPEAASRTVSANRTIEEAMEAKMANLLSQVKGAGAVSVSITLENEGIKEHAKNLVRETRTVQERDTTGGTRTTTETKETEQMLVSKDNTGERPVLVKETKPVVKGVLVIAEGAQDSAVKANLIRAVEAGMGIPAYKVTVLPHRR